MSPKTTPEKPVGAPNKSQLIANPQIPPLPFPLPTAGDLSAPHRHAMEAFYYLVFGALAAVVAALELGKSGKDRVATSPAFNSFKNNYILVYSLMMCTPPLLIPPPHPIPLTSNPPLPRGGASSPIQIWAGGAMPVGLLGY